MSSQPDRVYDCILLCKPNVIQPLHILYLSNRRHKNKNVTSWRFSPPLTFLHFVTQHVDLCLASAGAFVLVQTGDLQLRCSRGLCGGKKEKKKKETCLTMRKYVVVFCGCLKSATELHVLVHLTVSYSCHRLFWTPQDSGCPFCHRPTRAHTGNTDALRSCPGLQCPLSDQLMDEKMVNHLIWRVTAGKKKCTEV